MKKDQGLITDCVIPSDQLGTLSGKWRVTAVPIAFHQGDFSSAEMSEIIQAANTWNSFYGDSLGMMAIDYGTATSPRMATAPRPQGNVLCSENIMTGNSFTAPMVIYKDTTWQFPSQPSVIALTSFCRSSGSPLPYFYMMMMDINYQNFFAAGQRQPDLQSIVLHEFGHVMGLNHSCEATGRTGTPQCNTPGLDPDYLSALMFPSFSFNSSGQGQVKRSIQPNDQGRANCLYMNFN